MRWLHVRPTLAQLYAEMRQEMGLHACGTRIALPGHIHTVMPETPKWRGASINRRQFLAALGMAPFALRTHRARAFWNLGGSSTSGSGFLPTGHWLPAVMSMQTIYPLPNASVSSYARHLKAYYDGVHSVPMILPLGILGGALPLIWSIIEAPAGATIGATYVASGSSYGGYGDLIWYPQESISGGASFVIQATGQDGTQLGTPIEFTCSTSDTTSDFIFASPSGSDSAAGTYSAPFQTLAHIYGSSESSPPQTFPGTRLYLQAGTYATYSEENPDSGPGIVPSGGNNPVAVMSLPGTTVTLDLTDDTTANSSGAVFSNFDDASDLFLQGFGFVNSPSTQPAGFRYFQDGYLNNRYVFHNLSAPNVYSGTDPTGNATLISYSDPDSGTATVRNYIIMKGCSESNRNSNGTNSFALHDYYKVAYGITEFCSVTGNNGGYGPFLKASVSNWSMRYNESICTGASAFAMGTGCQNNTAASGNIEIAYNTLSNVSPGNGIALALNFLNQNSGQHWIYRNTLNGAAGVVTFNNNPSGAAGPFAFQDNAIQWGSLVQAVMLNSGSGYMGGSLPSNVTDSGTQCEAESSVLDVNLDLTGSYASYAGTRGAQIQ